MDNYDLTRTARMISDFVIDEVSNWYVRRNRRRFWKEGDDKDKLSAYQTLSETLVTLAKLVAPFAPFIADESRKKSLPGMEYLISEQIIVKAVRCLAKKDRLVSYSAKPKFASLGP